MPAAPATLFHLLLVLALWFGLGWAADSQAQELPTFEVIAKEGKLFPARLEVPTGTRIKLIVKNEGKRPIEFENLAMRVEKVLAPGGVSFVVLPKLKPGEYEFIDEFHMDTGKLLVIAK